MTAAQSQDLLSVHQVGKHYAAGKGQVVRAVDDVSFSIRHGETLALVGESGCGKSTTGRMILRLEEPSFGTVKFEGRDVNKMSRAELRSYRSKVQAVFQDPWGSLNPRQRVVNIIAEPLIENASVSRSEIRARVAEVLTAVGLDPQAMDDFPHAFSGGQRQRIAVARALILNPLLIVLDEPVSALDVSVRAQVMNLFKDIQARTGVAFVLIAHDLATVRFMADEVVVMYVGQIVERASSSNLFRSPLHPYTKALIEAARRVQPGKADDIEVLGGEVASPLKPPAGCRFHPRCPIAVERCSAEVPPLREAAPDHMVACHLVPSMASLADSTKIPVQPLAAP